MTMKILCNKFSCNKIPLYIIKYMYYIESNLIANILRKDQIIIENTKQI